MLYSTFNRGCKLIQKRLANITNQLNDLENNESLTETDENLIRKLLVECKNKYAEFNTKLGKFMEQEPPPNDFDEDGVAILSEDISNVYLDIICFIDTKWSAIITSKHIDEANTSNISTNNCSVKLPKLSLPK